MMAITVDSLKKVITIHTDHSSYQMQIDRFGYLIHLYYGQRTAELMDHLLVYADRGFSGNPYDAGRDRTYSLDSLPQEYPSQGTGDYRSPMLVVKDSHGTYGCDLRYRSHEIIRGKYSLDGLPAVYSDSGRDDAETLRIVLENKRTGVEVSLLYGVLPHLDIITRAAVVANRGDETFTVERLGSANLDFTAGGFDLMTFYGRHAMERIPERRPLAHGETVIGSRRGFSSHQFNPMMILLDRDTTETEGNCWSMQLVYSGGFRAVAELDQYGQTRMQMGLADEKFSITLALSLHAVTDEKRKEIMPIANHYTIAELMEAGRYYFDQTGRQVTFEYSLIRDVNDSAQDAQMLAELARPLKAHINLIPVNPVKERGYRQTKDAGVRAFQKKLEKSGINVSIRRVLGRDIDGACGQLRHRHISGCNEQNASSRTEE